MKKNFTTIISIAVSLFTAIAINTFLHPCQGMMKMHCVFTTHVATAIFALAALVGIAALFLRSQGARRVSGIISGVLGIALVFIPLIGSCAMETMRCNTYPMPAIRIGGVVLFLAAAVAVALSLRKRSELA